MDIILDSITQWLREILVGGIMDNLTGLFDQVNTKVGEIAGQVGQTPQAWNSSVYNMIRTLSDNVIVPIAGIVLAFVMTVEFIQLIIDRNNMHDFETFVFFKWIFKTACAVLIVTNTWNIVMAVFDVAQTTVNSAAGIIVADTAIQFDALIPDLEARLMAMDIGPLFGLWFQSLLAGICMWVLTICIFLITFGSMGQNYLRSLAALGLQAFLIIICVAIYAALVQNIPAAESISYAIWTCMGYTVLLAFTLFKTGSMAKSILSAH